MGWYRIVPILIVLHQTWQAEPSLLLTQHTKRAEPGRDSLSPMVLRSSDGTGSGHLDRPDPLPQALLHSALHFFETWARRRNSSASALPVFPITIMTSDEEFWDETTTSDRRPLNPDKATWWVTTSSFAHRLRRSLADHFAALQRHGIPYRRAETSNASKSFVRSAPRSRSFFHRRRSPKRSNSPVVTPKAGVETPKSDILERGVRAAKYWPPSNISQNILTEGWRGLEATVEFYIERSSLEHVNGAELSITFTHSTGVDILPVLLFGTFKNLNNSSSNLTDFAYETALATLLVPEGHQTIVFNVLHFIEQVGKKVSEEQIHIRFRIRRECDSELVGVEEIKSTFNSLASRLGHECHSILSDSNPLHHFLRVDYIQPQPQPSPIVVPKEKTNPVLKPRSPGPQVNNPSAPLRLHRYHEI